MRAFRFILYAAVFVLSSPMLDFFDKHLRGTSIARTFDRFPTEAELDAAAAAAKKR